MNVIRVAGAQIPVRDVRQNEQALLRSIERAAKATADIMLTPEGALSGYTHIFDRAAVEQALERVTAQARAAGVGLALGTCFVEDDGRCYNQLRFYERGGSYLGFHAKILLCGSLAHLPSTDDRECDSYASHALRTFTFEGITVAGLVCNDLWASPAATPMPDPYLLRQASELGAQIVFHAVNGSRVAGRRWDLVRTFHEANLRIRAAAAGVPVVTVDNAAPLAVRCSSPGGVVGPDGQWVVRAPMRGEQLFVADVEVPSTTAARSEFLGVQVSELAT